LEDEIYPQGQVYPRLRTTGLEQHLISSEASHMFFKIKQRLCTNVPKGAPQQLQCADKEQFKIK